MSDAGFPSVTDPANRDRTEGEDRTAYLIRQWSEELKLKAAAQDLNMTAWGIIANAYGGDWSQAPDEWREAAERWRDEWHESLDQTT